MGESEVYIRKYSIPDDDNDYRKKKKKKKKEAAAHNRVGYAEVLKETGILILYKIENISVLSNRKMWVTYVLYFSNSHIKK